MGKPCDQGAVLGEIIALSIYFLPAGDHDSVAVKIIPVSVYASPAADPVAFIIEVESLIVDRQPLLMIRTVSKYIVPNTIYLIPFGRPVALPEGSACQPAPVHRDTSAAGGSFKMIAIILSGIIGTV